MSELVSRTVRIRRGLIHRLIGFDRLFETKITNGQLETYGRGSTREASEQTALTKWKAKFAHVTEVTAYNFQIEVKGNNLTVTRPGSGFRAVYHKSAGQQELTLRKRTECEDHELLLQAWEAANLKARELGWIA